MHGPATSRSAVQLSHGPPMLARLPGCSDTVPGSRGFSVARDRPACLAQPAAATLQVGGGAPGGRPARRPQRQPPRHPGGGGATPLRRRPSLRRPPPPTPAASPALPIPFRLSPHPGGPVMRAGTTPPRRVAPAPLPRLSCPPPLPPPLSLLPPPLPSASRPHFHTPPATGGWQCVRSLPPPRRAAQCHRSRGAPPPTASLHSSPPPSRRGGLQAAVTAGCSDGQWRRGRRPSAGTVGGWGGQRLRQPTGGASSGEGSWWRRWRVRGTAGRGGCWRRGVIGLPVGPASLHASRCPDRHLPASFFLFSGGCCGVDACREATWVYTVL
ncbi:hypothetical protein BU14_0014s0080 [Porphyra umbilicalis]|uniref:Uncharacterized protein n=1 Tax=Porphyra umbilicalis TaxID=2786 RepID=A0A1X6PL46_PORUM|nr:hypothetical protein BU14_0014s0080 [Porphyra umbilicalis]|eukprot:OSX81530.1 hypothetical protein BU14_0014s0080 [Porphyra umbilicalis]